MKRLQEVQDKEKAPKLNKDASKRFIRSALWQQAHKEAEQPDDEGVCRFLFSVMILHSSALDSSRL